MVKNVLRFASIFICCSSVVGIYAHDKSSNNTKFSSLIIQEYSIPTGSSKGCLASCESFFTMSCHGNKNCLIYDRKKDYQLHGTRKNHFSSYRTVNAAILDNNKLVRAQSYDEGLWIDTLDHNDAPAQHIAFPAFPGIENNAYVKTLNSIPNKPTSLLAGIVAGKCILVDVHTQKGIQILPTWYVAQAIPDSTGNGLWYRTLQDGPARYNHQVGHYDIRSEKTTHITEINSDTNQININKAGNWCHLNLQDGRHLIFNNDTSSQKVKSFQSSNLNNTNVFCIDENNTIEFGNVLDIKEKSNLLTYVSENKHICNLVWFPSSDDESKMAYLENTQLLVTYEGDSAVKVYELRTECI